LAYDSNLKKGDWVASDDGYVVPISSVSRDLPHSNGIKTSIYHTPQGKFYFPYTKEFVAAAPKASKVERYNNNRLDALPKLARAWVDTMALTGAPPLQAAKTILPHLTENRRLNDKIRMWMKMPKVITYMADKLRDDFEKEGVTIGWYARTLKGIAEDHDRKGDADLKALAMIEPVLREIHTSRTFQVTETKTAQLDSGEVKSLEQAITTTETTPASIKDS
jgi:hypothetical protein